MLTNYPSMLYNKVAQNKKILKGSSLHGLPCGWIRQNDGNPDHPKRRLKTRLLSCVRVMKVLFLFIQRFPKTLEERLFYGKFIVSH